jgi:broad specificity phosphatase PhoE
MSIFLVRHGETALNVSRVLQPPDTPLSERGQAQAQAVALRLAGEPVAGLVSSDLLRARQTADAIALHGCALTVEPWVGLRERDFGDWRGQPYDGLPVDPLRMMEAPPGGESQDDFAQRCRIAWSDLVQLRSRLDGCLVVVSHGLTIRQLLQDLPVAAEAGMFGSRLGNTAVTVVDAATPYTVRLFNCTRHLGSGLKENERSLSGG